MPWIPVSLFSPLPSALDPSCYPVFLRPGSGSFCFLFTTSAVFLVQKVPYLLPSFLFGFLTQILPAPPEPIALLQTQAAYTLSLHSSSASNPSQNKLRGLQTGVCFKVFHHLGPLQPWTDLLTTYLGPSLSMESPWPSYPSTTHPEAPTYLPTHPSTFPSIIYSSHPPTHLPTQPHTHQGIQFAITMYASHSCHCTEYRLVWEELVPNFIYFIICQGK